MTHLGQTLDQPMPDMRRIAIASALVALLCSCTAPTVRPSREQLAAWTTALRDQQPDDAFAAVYKVGREFLVFIGAQHSTEADSLTFRMIADAYDVFDVDTVIVEGFPTSRGRNPERLIAYAAQSPASDGFQEGGETVPTVRGALHEGATIWGGEPDDSEIKARLLAQGISEEDVLGFYALRSIPQWMGERKIENAGDPRLRPLIEKELSDNRHRLGLEPTVLPRYRDWARWYQSKNGKQIGAEFSNEEVGPLADGRFGTNRVAAAISRERPAYLHELIASRLNAAETVLVVFGGSHLMIHRPALSATLGQPCYFGADLRRARETCRG